MSVKRKPLKRISLFLISGLFALQVVLAPQTAYAQPSVDCGQFEEYTSLNNDKPWFNPCVGGGTCGEGSGTLDGPPPTQLRGSSNAEKIWNYFIDRGLSPIGTAGAIGNIEVESAGFQPFVTNSIGAFGLVQWLGGRRPPVEAALAAAGITPDKYTDEYNDQGILVQLNYLWEEPHVNAQGSPVLPMPMAEFWPKLSAQTKVGGDTSIDGSGWDSHKLNENNGSLLYFHSFVERSSNEGIEARIASAEKYMQEFGGAAGTGTTGDCSVGQGGLTLSQAEALMQWWVPNRHSMPSDQWCTANDLYQCFAFSSFVHHHILGNPCVNGGVTGADIIATKLIAGGWKAVGFDTVQPFSVTQHRNHTFVVLGINDGKIIVGETDGNSRNDLISNTAMQGPNAKVYEIDSLSRYNGGEYHNFLEETLAAPPDAAAASQKMQEFLTANNIGS